VPIRRCALVLIGAGKTFIAADIRSSTSATRPQIPAVIAAVDPTRSRWWPQSGAALGGGFERARLRCPGRNRRCDGRPAGSYAWHHPGAGGTQRLPRLTGVAAAIEIITSARRVDAAKRSGSACSTMAKDDLRAAAGAPCAGIGAGKRQ
jgi:3-hydroxyacyl-CoA dehydrogenase